MPFQSLFEQKANKCRHFNGISKKVCRAGVDYENVKAYKQDGHGYNLPCFKDQCAGCSCEHQSFKTDEEINAEIAELDKRMEATGVARKAIVESLGGHWKKGMGSSSGNITCPVCTKGRLSFSRSGYNGHIHARCSTEGCVSWME